MKKISWVTPIMIDLNTRDAIQSGVVCVGYEAAMGSSVAFYTTGTGLVTVGGGCTAFAATTTCNGADIILVNGNACAPAATVCS